VVVILIGVFATMAIPQVTDQLRDRRIHEAAQRVALIYQQARIRAMGQGGAVLVHYDTTGSGHGAFTIQEGLVGGTGPAPCPLSPLSNCSLVPWATVGSTQTRTIESVDVGTEPGLGDAFASLIPDAASGSTTLMDVCFTPLGRSYIRYASGDPFAAMTGVPQFRVFHGTSLTAPDGRVRTVIVLPTGVARLQL
jgi:type IV fimbrial biogenesis protein FimT